MKCSIRSLCVCALGIAVSAVALAAEKPKPGSAPEKAPAAAPPPAKPAETPPGETPPVYKVKKELLKIEVSLKGVFEAERAAEIALRSQQWAAFEVLEAVEHGATVRRGNVLLRFDPEKIDEEIADLRTKAATSALALRQAELNLQALEASTPLDVKAAERAKQMADEDLATFLKVDRQLLVKGARTA